ncbi:nudix hydrolase 18, mitochondrial-like isoform X2 [Olea europaea var. sylvestris]|uniref:nudix hydrolase 18, mitochondrial-like isoform X1 n=1 Tax=Olea europaea var. sylvestris TaxID=158386 RepID=UPI000C1CE66D|nr:nudix hydrolase 18, mitochondrial-like isoform X1 [Olea europaea var. sylvestris]XP_022841498.1 nudix hydrolase 18, mitochondrial-like isoform X2 [Olea europaea var. sylvestris]
MQIKKLVSQTSRTGRHLQRYNQGCRLVVGCIPYRIRKTNTSSQNDELEVLLISSQKNSSMMFPKGGWEIDEDIELAASRETLEEAGVIGLLGDKLGEWIFKSKKQDKFHEGSMFSLLVTEELDVWPEKNVRQRKWMTVNEAREVCAHSWMKEALNAFARQFLLLQSCKDESVASCRAEEQRASIEDQVVEEKVDCYLVDGWASHLVSCSN